MKITFLNILFLFILFNTYAQNTFDLLIQSNENKELENAIELPNGNIILCGGIDVIDSGGYGKAEKGYLIKLNNSGDLLLEKKVNIPDSFLRFQSLFIKDDNSFIVFAITGKVTNGYANEILYQVYDFNFNLLKSKSLKMPNYNFELFIIKTLKDNENNFVLTGLTERKIKNKNYDFEMYFYKISNNGDSIAANFVYNDDFIFDSAHDIIQKKDGNGYYALTHGHGSFGQVFNLNNNLDIISYRDIPSDIGNYGTIKWYNDTSYIITGWDYLEKYNKAFEQDIGVIILDTLHNIINQGRFGEQQDTIDTPAPFNSIVYNEGDEHIYIAGTSNCAFGITAFSTKKSYIYFVKTNRNLEPVFEKFYKGDAYYFVSNFMQLSDGGFLFLSTRYDHTIQNNERDIYILKVDANGNLPVSIEEPQIKVHEQIIYPNPGNTNLNIRTAVQCIGGEFKMFDVSGKQVFQKNITQNITQIETAHLPAGTYIYSYVYKGKEIESGKWFKNAL